MSEDKDFVDSKIKGNLSVVCISCGTDKDLNMIAHRIDGLMVGWIFSCSNCFGKAKDKSQWFKTSKPLPDGDYGWRTKRGQSVKYLFMVVDGVLYHGGRVRPWEDYLKGEWCQIKFPD